MFCERLATVANEQTETETETETEIKHQVACLWCNNKYLSLHYLPGEHVHNLHIFCLYFKSFIVSFCALRTKNIKLFASLYDRFVS